MANINEENVSQILPTLGDEKIGMYLRKCTKMVDLVLYISTTMFRYCYINL